MLFKSKPKYDFAIAGLGNPEPKYEETRHNAGFRVVDLLIKDLNAGPEKNKFQALIYDAEIKGRKVLLVKPLTFMNASGSAVSEVLRFYKIPVESLIVVSDDASMDAGRLRIRKNGSHGGQKGLKDIIELLGSDNFPRVKVGMGQKPHPDYDLADWVLGKPTGEDKKKIAEAEKIAVQAIKTIISDDLSIAMNRYNR